jgi:hypothetical protein
MSFSKFFSSIGVVGATASSVGIAFQGVRQAGLIPSDLSASNIDETVMTIALRNQHYKPVSQSQRDAVISELAEASRSSLVLYCFICLKHEGKDVIGVGLEKIELWHEIFDEKLAARGVPSEIRYGYGINSYLDSFKSLIASPQLSVLL